MKHFIPRVWLMRAWTTDPTDVDDHDYDGREVGISWLGIVIAFTIARRSA